MIECTQESSNNTNKLSPQELINKHILSISVQIIQINLVLKNVSKVVLILFSVQIIQINLVLKNFVVYAIGMFIVQIIQINLVLKNSPLCLYNLQLFK